MWLSPVPGTQTLATVFLLLAWLQHGNVNPVSEMALVEGSDDSS
jgi:hypothetical protein